MLACNKIIKMKFPLSCLNFHGTEYWSNVFYTPIFKILIKK